MQPDDLKFGPRVVAYGEDEYITIFGAEAEGPAAVVFPSDPDREVKGRAFGVQQDRDTQTAAMVEVSFERERSSGLQGGADLFLISVYDDAAEKMHEAQLPGPADGSMGATSLYGDVAVLGFYDDTEKKDHYLAVDLPAGEVLWERVCELPQQGLDYRNSDKDPVIGADGTYAFQCGDQVEGVDVRSGKTRWIGEPEMGVMRVPSTGDYTSRYGYGLFSVATGKRVGPESDQMLFDPVSGLFVTYASEGFRTEEVYEGMQIVDAATGEAVLKIPAADLEKLGTLELLGAFDQRMWFWAKDGLDIVDMRTGERDPAAPARVEEPGGYQNIPLAAGDTWVLIGSVNGLGDLDITGIYRDPMGSITLEDIPQTSR